MKLKRSIITHRRWGKIIVTRNPRARRIIMRARPDGIHLTAPSRATEADIEKALEQCGERLLKAREANKEKPINNDYSIEAPNFGLSIREYDTSEIKITGNNGRYILLCPKDTDYSNVEIQQLLRNGIKAAIKHRAKVFLPQRLKVLADKHGFTYSRCTVRDCASHWGSCTSKGSISLNTQLVMLPDRLIDYVLLHELCHTVEMNHSDRFWTLMDRHTVPARAKQLRAELKKEKVSIP